MAHFLKGDTDNKKIDKILQKADDIDLNKYVEKGSAPELNYIYLEEHDETQSSGDDGVLENIDGSLYLNGNPIGGGGGTQLYVHHITSTEYGANVFNCWFVTKEPSYSNINAQTDNSDFIRLVNANINHQNLTGAVLTDADSKYFSYFTSVRFPKLDDTTTSISDVSMIYVFFLSFSASDIYKPSIWGFNGNFNAFASTNVAEIDLTKLIDTVTPL